MGGSKQSLPSPSLELASRLNDSILGTFHRDRMQKSHAIGPREVLAIKVHQWLNEWENVQWSPEHHKAKPEKHFYLFTLAANQLKALSGIQRRTTAGGLPRYEDLGIQRRHDPRRSEEIGRFIQYGFPWSDLTEKKRKSGGFDNLRKPGWLPTSIVVNILKPQDERHGRKVNQNDLIAVSDLKDDLAVVKLPKNFTGSSWKLHGSLPPIEIIDGQHRLWAFENAATDGNFELPVVAFYGLDIAWQAYLFYTINIKPKRINASLAYDLYPLLRTEDWLEDAEGHSIYRETRAQELTETLWAHSASPWHLGINMLGETGQRPMVSQAGWIRSLLATYVKGERKQARVSGLFGAQVEGDVLPWNRAQQAAFLILAGEKLQQAIKRSKEPWAEKLRGALSDEDPAFSGPHTLLSTDQGIRGFLYVTNDLCFVRAKPLKLKEFTKKEEASATDEEAVSRALTSFRHVAVDKYLADIAHCLSKYDWRTSSADDLSPTQRTEKAAFRGSGGYREIRHQLLLHLSKDEGEIGKAAKEVLVALGYK